MKFQFSLQCTAVLLVLVLLQGCASTQPIAEPAQLAPIAPEPEPGNSGDYMSPYTTDKVLAEWVDKAINAEMGASIGSTAGAYAGQKAMEQVPFIGGFLGSTVGESIGREVAVQSSGGWDYIESTSDQSFNSLEDLAVHMYVNYSNNKHYQDALQATSSIYPDLQEVYAPALRTASRQANNN